jgi:hypothetical protein
MEPIVRRVEAGERPELKDHAKRSLTYENSGSIGTPGERLYAGAPLGISGRTVQDRPMRSPQNKVKESLKTSMNKLFVPRKLWTTSDSDTTGYTLEATWLRDNNNRTTPQNTKGPGTEGELNASV